MHNLVDTEAIAALGLDAAEANSLVWAQPIELRAPLLAIVFIAFWSAGVLFIFLITLMAPEFAGEDVVIVRWFLLIMMVIGGYMISQMRLRRGLFLATDGEQLWVGEDGEKELLSEAYKHKVRVTQQDYIYTLSLIPKSFDNVRVAKLGVRADLLPTLKISVKNRNYRELALGLSNILNIPIHYRNGQTERIIQPGSILTFQSDKPQHLP